MIKNSQRGLQKDWNLRDIRETKIEYWNLFNYSHLTNCQRNKKRYTTSNYP